MGKGDKRSKKGKIAIGSYGVRRPRPSAKAAVAAPVASEKKKAKPAPKAEKPAAKKVTKKKAEE